MKKRLLFAPWLRVTLAMGRRISCILLLTSLACGPLLAASSPVRVQTGIDLDQPLTLRELFNVIMDKTEYSVLYSNEEIDNQVKVKVDLEKLNKDVEKFLKQSLKGSGLSFRIVNKQIIIKSTSRQQSIQSTREEVSPAAPVQESRVKGVVTDETGQAMVGVNVLVKGTSKGTTTDLNGEYNLVVDEGDVLLFSFIGYITSEIPVGNSSQINVDLKPDVAQLSEVVVVGYGTQKKVNLTGAVSAVKGEEILKRPVANTTQALQGMVPGLTVIDRGGAPGQDNSQILLRGVGSLSAGTYPLIIVDGVPQDWKDIDPNDIESISVLKDAASAAIYGARAANGVILITTKRGSKGGLKMNYNGYYGVQTPATLPESVSAKDYFMLVNEAYVNGGQPAKYSDEYIQKTLSGEDPVNYPFYNLFEELYKDAPIQKHHVSLAGGNDFARAAMSFNFQDQDGLLKNVNNKRYGLRLNTDFTVSPKLNLGVDVNYIRKEREYPHRMGEAINQIVGSPPNILLKNPKDGTYGLNKNNSNPLAALEVSGMDTRVDEEYYLSLKGDYKIIEGLTATARVALNSGAYRSKDVQASYDFVNYANDWVKSFVREQRWNSNELNLRGLLNYEKDFGKHGIKVLGGYSRIDYKNHYLQGYREDLYNNDYPELNLGSLEGAKAIGYPSTWGLESFFGRVNYSFADRYLLEVNIRRDGSSRFAKGNRWGTFPSVSAAWRISEEAFMQSLTFIDNLKLRASYGTLGNQDIGLFKYASYISADISHSYTFNKNTVQGYTQEYYANTNISWETSKMVDVGIDLSLFNGKLNVVADWFEKRTEGLLQTLPISKMVGLAASEVNAGDMKNTGWELALTHRNSLNDFKYSVGVNLSDVKNELVDLKRGGEVITFWDRDTQWILQEGKSVGSIYGYKSDGLFQSQDEIDKHPTQSNHDDLKPGDIKLVDLNGDGVVDEEDRTIIGNNIPRYTFGLNLSAQYKGFDFAAFFQGVMKVDNYYYGAANEGANFENFTSTRVLDRWTESNPGGTFPRLEVASNKNNSLRSDFWVRDASYFRLKNIQLGYTFPSVWTEKIKIERARVYVGGTNLFTITDVESGLDPENYSGRPTYYPPVTIYSMGVNLTF
ncbi:TonB-dependent receptor [Rapidithrix thailandica]|uniref:TonB-dependent receptor n=1 Tax=Rapidithrix thailandica TaxID=413964 RepID=A0AAW9S4X0_9BACT